MSVDWAYLDLIAEGGPFSIGAYCRPHVLALGVIKILFVDTVNPYYIPGIIGLVGGIYNDPDLPVGFVNFMIMIS